MANWKLKLDLSDVWKTEDPKLISAEIARRASLLVPDENGYLKEIADAFRDLSEQEDPDVEDFDALMKDLYDWADTRVGPREKLCWVATL